jgi:hypothetical protein
MKRLSLFRIANAQSVFSHLKKVWKNMKINMRTKIRILEITVMAVGSEATVVKYGSETSALRKTEEDLLDVFQRNCLWIVLGI